jgi:hypothetical protein
MIKEYGEENMKKRMVKFFAAIIVFLLSVLLGVSVLFTPAPSKGPDTEFSAYRAAEHIKVISESPHTINDQAELQKIREYLKSQLEALGASVELKQYTVEGYQITNVYGTLKGSSGDGALLLVAHYDSNPGVGVGETPGSHGASDDAYGVSVILECLRAVKAMGEAENTIYVAFTDGEETDMLGAQAASGDALFAGNNAKAVMNIESRGLRGPAIMFETSADNEALFSFYAQRAKAPATWSLASDVYRIMPNFTDFTSFIEKGMNGLNFSNLDSLSENHTKLDVYENISLSAVQGYGNQMLPVIAGFAQESLPQSFDSQGDMAFFTLLPGVLISYPSDTNYLLLGLSLIAVAAYIIAAALRKRLKPKRLIFSLTVIGLALAAAVAGELISYLLSLIFNIPFKPTNMPQVSFQGGIAIIAVILLCIALFFIIRSLMKKGWKYEELVGGTLIAFLALQAAFTLALPGGAFLFGWGCLSGALFALIALLLPTLRSLTGFAAVLVAAPVVALLHVALTIGALGAVLLFSAFPLMLFIPAIAEATVKSDT